MAVVALPFGDLLAKDEIERFETCCSSKRKRIYTPSVTLKAFLSQTVSRRGSCQEAVNAVHLESVNYSKESCSLNTSSYARARKRLSLDGIRNLTKEIHMQLSKNIDKTWLWKRRKVTILDGSTIAMADTDENIKEFPKRGDHNEYSGYPIARVVLAGALETGSIVDFNLAPWKGKGTGELPLASALLDSIEAGNVLIADAMFVSFSFIGLCVARHLDFLAPQKARRRLTIIESKKIDDDDRIIIVKKPKLPHTGWISEQAYSKIPETITLRETHVAIQRNGFRTKSVKVLSTLTDHKEYSKLDLADLLLSRWKIELDIKIVKRELGLNFLSGKSPDMVRKEIWTNLLAFNLMRRLINTVAKHKKIPPRKISFKKTLDYYLASFQQQNFTLSRIPTKIVDAISKFILRKQKDRFEPRAKKSYQGHNDFPILTLTRRRWKLIQLMPLLSIEFKFSTTIWDGFKNVKMKIPLKNGVPVF